MYVHELSGFDSDFYVLDGSGVWQPDLVEDWVAGVTPAKNLRRERSADDPGQPFQRAHVIARDGRQVGFACVGLQPFCFVPRGADYIVAEFFLIHAARGDGTGQRALELLFERYPGRFSLHAIHDNERAIRFWRKTLPRLGVRDLEEEDEDGDLSWRFATAGP